MEENKGFKDFYKKHKSKFNFAYMVIICLVVAKLLTTFVFLSVVVSGPSMLPTLQNGDKAITDGLFFRFTGIDRFDIVILEEDGYDDKLVKRVIGLPGEKIEYIDSVLYVNGEKIEESFLPEGTKTEMIYVKDFYYQLGNDDLDNADGSGYEVVVQAAKGTLMKSISIDTSVLYSRLSQI